MVRLWCQEMIGLSRGRPTAGWRQVVGLYLHSIRLFVSECIKSFRVVNATINQDFKKSQTHIPSRQSFRQCVYTKSKGFFTALGKQGRCRCSLSQRDLGWTVKLHLVKVKHKIIVDFNGKKGIYCSDKEPSHNSALFDLFKYW